MRFHRGLLAVSSLVLLATVVAPSPATAGSPIQALDVTAREPSPVPGQVVAGVVPRRWDTACIPVIFKINDTLDPIPNPLGGGSLSVSQAAAILQQAANRWNDIPTSFIDMQIDGTVSNPGPAGFDQIHEITFRYDPAIPPRPRVSSSIDFGAIAYLRTTISLSDFSFFDGLDLDGDGDSDVSSSLSTCGDVDGDGDIEVPAKLYPAGTTFDADIVLSSGENTTPGGPSGFRFTAGEAAIDDDPQSVDLLALGTQMFGTAHFVGHTLTNQTSPVDGTGSTMFPSLDTGDALSEQAARTLDPDSVATSSLLYPEGSASSGPAALQPGDVAFDSVFGRIEGEIHHGPRGEPLTGASVFAEDVATGRIVGTAISGTSQWSTLPNGFGAVFLDAGYHVLDGRYTLVVPPGTYRVGVEAVDDFPVGHANVNLNTILAFELGQDHFPEEYYDGPTEGMIERAPGRSVPVRVRAGEVHGGVDIVTNQRVEIGTFGSFDSLGLTTAQGGSYYAVRIPEERFLEADDDLDGDAILQGAEFLTGVERSSDVPVFAQALLTRGTVHPDGSATIDLRSPIVRERPFVAQDFDFSPWYFKEPEEVAHAVRKGFARGRIDDLFLVLQLPDGGSALPLVGLDGGPANDVPISGDSFVSTDGASFSPVTEFNFMFRLLASAEPHEREHEHHEHH